MSFDLHCNGRNTFHSHLMNMSEYFKLPDFNPDLLDIAMVKSYVSSMKQEYISYWQNTLQHSQKLEFYRSFKTDHTSSSYLDLTRGTAGRRALVKLRISNHKLMTEIGWYNQTTKDNRHCPSLRGRRLKGKGKGVLGKGVLGALIPFPFPFERLRRRLALPFLWIQSNKRRSSLSF